MNTREILLGAVGLVAGVILGAIIIGATAGGEGLTEADVRQLISEENAELEDNIREVVEVAVAQNAGPDREFQTRQSELVDSAFFLVTMDQTATWLEDNNETLEELEIDDGVAETALAAQEITSSEDLELYFDQQVNTVDGVLANVYSVMRTSLGDEANIEVCLGLDQDPYSIEGPIVYLYLQVPDEATEEFPKEWELLDGPREESMLWSAECYDPETAEEESIDADDAEADDEEDA
jgi:hypothetical protein